MSGVNANLEWGNWFNQRLFEAHGQIPPAEYEEIYYRHEVEVDRLPLTACMKPGAVHSAEPPRPCLRVKVSVRGAEDAQDEIAVPPEFRLEAVRMV